jgi:cytochrome P450 family 4
LDELDAVFCGDVERPCTTQDIAELKYLECCIKETIGCIRAYRLSCGI